jgi:divalent metal cation (Fe/Co/Zn/Cd) transporter
VAAVLVAIWILKSSAGGISQAFRGLTDAAIDPDQVKQMRETVVAIGGVTEVDAVRSRHVGQTTWIDLEVFIDGDLDMAEGIAVKDDIKRAVAGVVSDRAKIVVYLKPAPTRGSGAVSDGE